MVSCFDPFLLCAGKARDEQSTLLLVTLRSWPTSFLSQIGIRAARPQPESGYPTTEQLVSGSTCRRASRGGGGARKVSSSLFNVFLCAGNGDCERNSSLLKSPRRGHELLIYLLWVGAASILFLLTPLLADCLPCRTQISGRSRTIPRRTTT